MKKSIRWRFTLAFVITLLAVFTVSLLINRYFLQSYYFQQKEDALVSAYETYSGLMGEEAVPDVQMQLNVLREARTLYERYNISTIILNDGGKDIYVVYANDANTMFAKLQDYLLKLLQGQNYADDTVLLRHTDRYHVLMTRNDQTQNFYMECWGTLSGSGQYFIMSAPVESMKESVGIANQFYIYVGIVCMAAGALYIFFATKKMVKPLEKLTTISKKMANLDFSEKYHGREQDEIGVLGNNMNHMSNVLEDTISELKRANQELQKDIEEKIQIDDMRKEFLGNVSHELKTPLALIQGYAEGLQDCINDDPESREFYCSVIMDEADKMNQMVKKLLNLNQLEFGENQLDLERFDLVSMIRGVLMSSNVLGKGRDVTVRFQQTEPVWVLADEFMMEEVVSNYISNAYHHLDEKNRIEVTLEKDEEKVRVSVFNSGLPIPEDDLDKVWIKFYKVDKARTRAYGGSGIGLSIVKAIMDSHKQAYGVYNKEDGVVFWFDVALFKEKGQEQN